MKLPKLPPMKRKPHQPTYEGFISKKRDGFGGNQWFEADDNADGTAIGGRCQGCGSLVKAVKLKLNNKGQWKCDVCLK